MEVYQQAAAAACCCLPWATRSSLPVYWDKILINASQVTNPSIDPLREPMETKTFSWSEAVLKSSATRTVSIN